LLLEGTDIQELLAQIRAEHGSAAKIISADRVRTAGVAGLFAKQRYELTVEIADGSGAGALGTTTAAAPTGATSPAAATSPADSLVALVEAQEQEMRPYLGWDESAKADSAMRAAQEISTGTASFADVLSGYGAQGWKVPAVSSAVRTPATTTEPEAAEPEVPEPDVAPSHLSPWAAAVWKSTTPVVTPLDMSILSGAASAGPKQTDPNAIDTAAIDTKPTWAEPRPAETAPAELVPAATMPAATMPAEPAPTATAPESTHQSLAIPRNEPTQLTADTPLPIALAQLGLPAELAEMITGSDWYREISRVVKLLPEAPSLPARAGEVLVIIGELRAALEVARTVGETLNLPSSQVLVAASGSIGTDIPAGRRVAEVGQAAKRVAKLRHESALPLILVVDSAAARPTADGGGNDWARSIVERVGATSVWAVVDATRKTADSSAWLASIGHADALAVHGCAVTGDPAAVLQLGVPVAMIDSRTATPAIWAELLCRRLEEVTE
jgi:hypothetical protein